MNKTINIFLQQVKKRFQFVYFVFGLILVAWGEHIVGLNKPYRFISHIIENSIQSWKGLIRVSKIEERPLYYIFKIPKRQEFKHIDREYWHKELINQLGCSDSDVSIEENDKFIDICITKTAVINFEKGFTPIFPLALPGKRMELAKEENDLKKLN